MIDAGAPMAMPWLNQVSCGPRRLVPGPVERDLAGAGAVRPGRPERPPAGHVPGESVAGSGLDPGPVPRDRTVRCSTPRASTSAIAGMTPSTSDAAVPVRVRAVVHAVRVQPTCASVPARRRRPRRPGVRDGHERRQPVRRRRGPAVPGRPGRCRRAPASAGRLPARPAESRTVPAGAVHDHPARHVVVGRRGRTAGPRPPACTASTSATPRHCPACRCATRSR